MKTKKPTDPMIAFAGILGLMLSFILKFPPWEMPLYLGNLSGFFQISSCVLLSYFGGPKRQTYWKRNRNNPKAKSHFLWFAAGVLAIASVLLLWLYTYPRISWFLETLLSILLGIFVSINDIVDPTPQNKKWKKQNKK